MSRVEVGTSSLQRQPRWAEPIAIVGMAGRFPGADTLAQFWTNLANGVESITVFSDEALAAAGVDPELLRNPRYVGARGCLRDVELFDAAFFGYSPREAEIMDPQHRVFLEIAWAALEDAGYAPGVADARVGVYAGCSINTYLLNNLLTNQSVLVAAGAYQAMLGNDKDFLTTRVSYKLNLRGPSVTVQTACSTSLVAVQMACQALLTEQCDMALAGGVAITVPRVAGYLYETGMILSPDGHCRAFDAGARGTVGGEGAGIVVLKRLRDALADGDHIHAVILGAASNNDGSGKVGYTAPSVDGQAAVIAAAQDMSGVHPESVTYVEAHGTGTELGDPIEIAALTQAFRRGTDKTAFCAVGSVKTNLGHLDAAAGVASLIKTILALGYRTLPPSLHFTAPNPQIDFASSPFYVNATIAEWRAATPRRAGVSSFGIGGTNAHVVLEEAPPKPAPAASRPVQALTLSARSQAALEQASADLGAHLAAHPELDLADIAFTLHRGRAVFPHRRVIVASSVSEAVTALAAREGREVMSAVDAGKGRPVVFMFPGQGTQYVEMTRGLYEAETLFREHVDAASAVLRPWLGLDLRDILYPTQERAEWARGRLGETSITQPALFVVEHALARLWMSVGVRPRAMIGHSVGEYVAACLADVMSMEDALRLVVERGRLMQIPGGAMLAVPLSERELMELLDGELAVAAVNGPALCAVSGPAAAVERLEALLGRQGVKTHRIHTVYAFHSPVMDVALPEFRAAVTRIALHAPQVPYISNVTGTWITDEDATDPSYWTRHLRQTVRFWDGVQEVALDEEAVLLEVGPGQTLASLARQQQRLTRVVTSVRHAQDQQSDAVTWQRAIGRLWLAGVPIDWAAYHAAERRQRVPLPTYPFERRRHWVMPGTPTVTASRQAAITKRADMADWFYAPSWRRAVMREVPVAPARSWLVFVDGLGVGAAVIERLRTAGARVATVTSGAVFARRAADDYTVDPEAREDYARLIAAVSENGLGPDRVLHLGALVPEDAAAGLESCVPEASRSFYSVLFLVQALAERGMSRRREILIVANGLYDVIGERASSPGRAAALGPCIVAPQEFPNMSCRLVDVMLSASNARDVAAQIICELDQPLDGSVVAYRGPHRWILDYEPIRLEARETDARLRAGGVYLITGGFGGVGGVLARELAGRFGAKLALVGRSPLPPREQWRAWIESRGAGNPTSARIALVRDLEALGARVLALSADVSVPTQAAEVVQATRRQFGKIDGVIHAAGVAGGGIVQLKTREIADPVLHPKVAGTSALWERLAEEPLDFVLLCSSITAILGGSGQVDYCAANNVLDAFARSAGAASGATVVSVNWDAWSQVGMAAGTVVPQTLRRERERQLAEAILPGEGFEVFRRVLGSGLHEVVVSTRDLHALARLTRSAGAARDDADSAESEPSAPGTVTRRSAAPDAPTTELERTIAGIWEHLLGVEAIGIHDDFFDAGGHSLLATQVMARLYQRFGIDVPLRTLFEARTLAAFAERVEALVQPVTEGREEIEI